MEHDTRQMTCGCTATETCERHTLMKAELARRYGRSSDRPALLVDAPSVERLGLSLKHPDAPL